MGIYQTSGRQVVNQGLIVRNINDKTFIMKTMTCKQLGGACALEFHANTFEEIAEQSKQHGIEMMKAGDELHLKAMSDMGKLMQSPEGMTAWFEEKRKEFESLKEND